MKTITDTTFNFLKGQYHSHVHEFLDDPDGMCTPAVKPGEAGYDLAVAREIAGHYRTLAVMGPDCETTFWAAALKEGTPCEISNLVGYLRAGGITDIPQEALDAGVIA